MKRMNSLSQLNHLLGAMCSGKRPTERGAQFCPFRKLASPPYQARSPDQLQRLSTAVSQVP